MAWVIELTGLDPADGTEKTVRFAIGPGISPSDSGYIHGGAVSWNSPSQRIDIGAEGVVQIRADAGRVVIGTAPLDIRSAGDRDYLQNWIWQNRTARLFHLPGQVWANRVQTAMGVLEQPISDADTTSFELRDPRASLDTPLQPERYAGDGTVEGGGADLKGRPKPIIFGLVSNISPPCVMEPRLIYQIADRPVAVLCVRDGGVSMGLGQNRPSLASLFDNDAKPGFYDYVAAPTGTYIRLGSRPVFGITVDADEAPVEADQSHARIWQRIRQRVGSAIDLASVATADAADPHGAGFYWDREISQRDALDEVLGSFSGYEVMSLSGAWRVGKLVAPAAPSVIDFVLVGEGTRMSPTARAIATISRVRPSYTPTGAPPFRVTVNWGRNYTTMDASDFAGVASQRLRDKFATEYRAQVETDLTIWNPDTRTGPWLNAPELSINTAYQPGNDGVASPGAEAEANRLLALLGPLRAHYQLTYAPEPGDILEPGMVASITYPRWGLEESPLFRILQSRFTVDKNGPRAGAVVGLQT